MSATVQSTAAERAFDMVCLTASLGGVFAYGRLLSALPPSFPAAIVLVQHRSAELPDNFPTVLNRHSALPVVALADGHVPAAGTVHVVPAGQETVFGPDGAVTLRPKKGHRLADAMFTSAAALHGPRLIAGVLSGRLDDGTAGVRHVKGAGGRVLAQDESTCQAHAYQMPASAIATGCVDFVLPLPVLADAITALVMAPGAASMMRTALPPWAQAVPPRTGTPMVSAETG
ncbi:chemotaxis protein CheB [Planobispora takensis]|uniref:chemotaxis protein CheB n=1 Tax=Planobispora takensis TaxID=1367882 RepID=UPI001943B9C5|nr:chemotaxis protein CheB [Planobispora takensis]